jgi:hypothetical protein
VSARARFARDERRMARVKEGDKAHIVLFSFLPVGVEGRSKVVHVAAATAFPLLSLSSRAHHLPSFPFLPRPEINPTGALPVLDPEDAYLLSNPDPVQAHPSALSHANSLVDNGSSAPGTPSGGHIDVNSHVSWLRKTEYIQKDAVRAGGVGLKG